VKSLSFVYLVNKYINDRKVKSSAVKELKRMDVGRLIPIPIIRLKISFFTYQIYSMLNFGPTKTTLSLWDGGCALLHTDLTLDTTPCFPILQHEKVQRASQIDEVRMEIKKEINTNLAHFVPSK